MADLNTLFVAYIVTLKTAAPAAKDVATLIAKDLATVRAGVPAGNLDDANTMYFDYLTP
jgi:hypothetical protein